MSDQIPPQFPAGFPLAFEPTATVDPAAAPAPESSASVAASAPAAPEPLAAEPAAAAEPVAEPAPAGFSVRDLVRHVSEDPYTGVEVVKIGRVAELAKADDVDDAGQVLVVEWFDGGRAALPADEFTEA